MIAYDRPGWGSSESPPDHRRTSIAEQSIEAAGVLRARGVGSARVLGVGLGAVVALELALAEPELVESSVLVEPPVFDTLPAATEGMSRDVDGIREAAAQGGEEAVWQLYLDGGLPTLGPGAERLRSTEDPEKSGRDRSPAGAGPAAAHTLLVELPAVSAWPLDPVRMAKLATPVTVATTPDSPPLLVEAADALVPRIPGARRVVTGENGPAALAGLLART